MQANTSQATQPKPNPNSYDILLVEDEGLIARDIAQRVEALGHRVVATVSTGEEAVESAGSAQLVLMDIRLDGRMDGIQAAEIIRRRFAIPVIFLTAHADRATLERAKLVEPFGYIVKPVAPAALYTSIEIAVYKHAAARELAEREAWLSAILGSVADAVVVADVQGIVRTLNPAAESLTGWTEAEAKGRPLAQIAPLASAPQTGAPGVSSVPPVRVGIQGDPSPKGRTNSTATSTSASGPLVGSNAALNEGPVPLAMLRDAAVSLGRHARLTTRAGRGIAVEGSAAPVHVAEGSAAVRTVGSVLSLRDVGQRRWEEQQLQQTQKVEAAARLAAGVVDDYSTLLSVIRAQAERLLEQFADYSPARTAAEEIRQATAAAEQITRKLAGFGKRHPGHPTVLSPNGILRRMSKLLETVAGAGVHVTVRPGLHAGKVNADEGQFEQLLMNLTMHAGRMSAAGGEVRIETGTPDMDSGVDPGMSVNTGVAINNEGPSRSYVCLTVSYTPASESDAPFDPVPQDDESMALSVAHNIVTEHNGFFSVRRSAGSRRLEVLLPRWLEPAATVGTVVPPAQTRSVLLIEPHELVRSELHKFFEANGFNLIEAADSGEALSLAEVRDEPIDLLIASSADVPRVEPHLRGRHPALLVLSIVDEVEHGSTELRRSFTQSALLDRVRLLLKNSEPADNRTAEAPDNRIANGNERADMADDQLLDKSAAHDEQGQSRSAIAASSSKK